jgi:hypothetical protein
MQNHSPTLPLSNSQPLNTQLGQFKRASYVVTQGISFVYVFTTNPNGRNSHLLNTATDWLRVTFSHNQFR